VITTPIYTRLLSASEYGEYSVFTSWLSIATVIISLSLSGSIFMQGIVKFEDNKHSFGSASQGLSLLLALVWFGIFIISPDFWSSLLSLPKIQIAAMILIIWENTAFNFWISEQRMDLNYSKPVTITIAHSILLPIINIILILHAQNKATARIMGTLFAGIIAYTGCFFSQVKRGKQLSSKEIWLYLLKLGIPLIPHYLSAVLLSSVDRIMIERMAGTEAAGIYSSAYSVSLITGFFSSAVMQVIDPWIYKKIKANQCGKIAPIAYSCLSLMAILCIVFIAFAPEIV